MPDAPPPPDWLDRANHLATIAWLLSTAVHDANNLLQVISGNAEMIETLAAGNDGLVKRGASIGVNARKASAVLTELLEYSRDAAPAAAVSDLRALAERAIAMRNYAMKKLRIATALEGEPGIVVRMQPRSALQIVLNLIVNAEQALTGRPDPRITVRIHSDGSSGFLSVEDNGPGVPEARRADDVFAPAIGGAEGRLGLGLSVSKRLAAQQGGALTYAPSAGSGCVFTLRLPRG